MKKKVIIHYPLFIFLIINILSFLLLYYFYKNEFSNYILFKTILFIGSLWFPYIITKLIKTDFPKLIYQLYYLIIVIDLLFGNIFMIDRILGIYNYLVLFIQGIVFYIFGLWVIRFIDDYGFLNYKTITIFSFLFAIVLSSLKEIFFYFVRNMFAIEKIDQMLNLLIATIGTVFVLILSIIDFKYYNNKYYKLIDNEFTKRNT